MKPNLHLGTLLLLIIFGCGFSTKNTVTALKDESPHEKFNFELIKEWVKDKKIVALGESTHGIGEYFSLKSELVQYLHEELDFEILALEGGFGDLNLAWLNKDELSFKDLRDKSLFGNFRCTQITPLFQYIKAASENETPLVITGFDPQISGSIYEEHLDSISSFLKLPFDLEEEFSFYSKIFTASFEPDSTNFTTYKNRYQHTLTEITTGIIANKDHLKNKLKLSEQEIQIILKALELQYLAVDYSFANRMNAEYIPKGVALRDFLMAENIEWIIDNLYPDKKILIWGHNAHIQSGPFNSLTTKWMGQLLKEKYGEDYFSIGLFSYKGNAYQHWNKESVAFENDESDFIEKLMSKGSDEYSYQNFSIESGSAWVHQKVRAFEPENNGIVSFVPAERFDASICILEGTVPNFE